MTKKVMFLIIVLVGWPSAWAQEFSAQDIIGQWEFTAYADFDTPDERVPVGVLFEFFRDGTLITRMTTDDVESRYSVDGDTIYYSGKGGEQTWVVLTFEPDVSMVLNHSGTLMYLERR